MEPNKVEKLLYWVSFMLVLTIALLCLIAYLGKADISSREIRCKSVDDKDKITVICTFLKG